MDFITKEETLKIKDSWERLKINSPRFADDFYDRVFDICPDSKEMFKKDMCTQANLFMKQMTHIIDKIEIWETLASDIHQLGVKHKIEYKINFKYFETFWIAFFATLKKALGDEWMRFKMCWESFYAFLMKVMFL
jgi:hemoglobin-like flavoprotein